MMLSCMSIIKSLNISIFEKKLYVNLSVRKIKVQRFINPVELYQTTKLFPIVKK